MAAERNFWENLKDKLKMFELEKKKNSFHFFFVKIG